MATPKDQPDLIYIYSAAHSGSTLLSSLLNQQREIFNAGEIGYLRQHATRDNLCGCGKKHVLECEFWASVDERLQNDGLRIASLEIYHKDASVQDKALFKAIAQAAHATVIVDSSKNHQRLHALMENGFDVLPVILLADPRKLAYSMRRRVGWLKFAFRLNRRAIRTMSIVRASVRRPIVVDYSDLCDDPEKIIREIVSAAGLTYAVEDSERHDFAGNQNFKKSNTLAIRKDVEWQKTPLWQQAGILIASPLYAITSYFLKRRPRHSAVQNS